MRVGIFDPYLDTMSGGEKYILTAALCLSGHHSVSIFWDNADEVINEAKRRFNFDLGKISFKKNIFSKDISLFSRLSESRKYDLIIYLSDGSIPLLLTKLIIHFQTPVEWVKNDKLKTFFKTRRIHQIICNSLFTKSYIDKKFKVNSRVLYPPVKILQEYTEKKENVILNVGRFGIRNAGSSYKKQEFLVDVFRNMKNSGLTGWSLHILVSVSDTSKYDLSEIRKMAEGYPIRFIVNPDSKTLWEEYAKAKIYWHASGYGEDLNRYPDRAEHFGISTVEAMGAGAVPVVINAGGQPEIVTDDLNGFLWENEKELIEKTQSIITDHKIRERLSVQAVKDADRFTIGKFCSGLTALLP